MTALLIEHFKLIILFVLVGTVIGLSHAGSGNAAAARPSGRRTASARL